jgi:hypothetical protein
MKHMINEAKEGERETVMSVNASIYMNDPLVLKALHLENFTGAWSQCIDGGMASNNISWNYHV